MSIEEKEKEDVFEEAGADLENIQEIVEIPKSSFRRSTRAKNPP